MHSFRGAFAELRKATISFVMSVRPHETTRLPLDRFSWNLTFEYFSKMCRENSSFTKIEQELRAHYMKTNIYFRSCLARLFLEWEISRTKVVEKIETHSMFNNSRPEVVPFICGKMWYRRTSHRLLHNTAYVHCMLVN
jgi:hypothetical protein